MTWSRTSTGALVTNVMRVTAEMKELSEELQRREEGWRPVRMRLVSPFSFFA